MGLSKALQKQTAPQKQNRRGRPRRRAASISSEESADGDVEEDSEDAEDASEDDDQSDADEPVLYAPTLQLISCESGRFSVEPNCMQPNDDDVSLFHVNSDDDNDDAIYLRVDDISDYDDDEDEREDEDELTAAWEAEAEQDPDSILDQLDENSVFGFSADLDDGEEFVAFSSEGENMPEVEIKRRVHFSTEDMLPRVATESLSPVLTRTLLPSALPPLDISAAQNASGLASSADAAHADAEPEEEDPYDCMCLCNMYFYGLLTRCQLMLLLTIFLPRLILPLPSLLTLLSMKLPLYLPLRLPHHESERRAKNKARRTPVPRDLVRVPSSSIKTSHGGSLMPLARELSCFQLPTLSAMTGLMRS